MEPLVGVLTIIGCLLLLLACFGWGQPRIDLAIEHRGQAVNSLDEPADLFSACVYQRLKENLTAAGLPDSRVGFGPGHLFGNRTLFGNRLSAERARVASSYVMNPVLATAKADDKGDAASVLLLADGGDRHDVSLLPPFPT